MDLRHFSMWCIPAVLGVFSHVLYFRRGEHHLQSLLYFTLFIIFPCLTTFTLRTTTSLSVRSSLEFSLRVEFAYGISICISTLFYRVSPFHRLHRFPGPLTWRVTKLTQSYSNRNLRGMESLHALHSRYGEYVRTGPTEISITDPDSIQAIHGVHSKCIRAPWYDMAKPLKSLFEIRERGEHARRRRIWDQAFSTKALAQYEPRIKSNIEILIRQIEMSHGANVNISELFNYFSLDVIMDLAFSKSLRMMDSMQNRDGTTILDACQSVLPILGPCPWIFTILTRVPGLAKPFWKMVDWCMRQTLRREQQKPDTIDIISYLLRDDALRRESWDARQWLQGDSRIVIAAGSAAVSSTLSFSVYHLAKDECQAATIRNEVLMLQRKGRVTAKSLQSSAHNLNAFITEVLRLYPPNPSGFLRLTPKEGLMIREHFIPGSVTVCTPLWSLHRSPKCFQYPESFIPERWTTKPELILQKEGFVAFGYGPYGCVGKQLALMELRLTLAALLMKFEFKFRDDEAGMKFLEGARDTFTLAAGDLYVDFESRVI